MRTSSFWDVPPRAAVYAEQKNVYPAGSTQAVELLRFITAYRVGFEAFADLTPYSALLRAAAEGDGELRFYGFIDTWMGNATGWRKAWYLEHGNRQCYPRDIRGEFQGNGFGLSAELLFWPSLPVDTRPRESVTLSSGFYGSYGVGAVIIHEGKLAGALKHIVLNEATDTTGVLDAKAYACPGGARDVLASGLILGIVQKAWDFGRNPSKETELANLLDGFYVNQASQHMSDITVTQASIENGSVTATYNTSQIKIQIGTPVFVREGDVVMDNNGSAKSYPFKSVGSVMNVSDGGGELLLKIDIPCFSQSGETPRFMVPNHANVLANAQALVGRISQLARKAQSMRNMPTFLFGDTSNSNGPMSAWLPMLITPQGPEFGVLPFLGDMDLSSGSSGSSLFERFSLAGVDSHDNVSSASARGVFANMDSDEGMACDSLLGPRFCSEAGYLHSLHRFQFLNQGAFPGGGPTQFVCSHGNCTTIVNARAAPQFRPGIANIRRVQQGRQIGITDGDNVCVISRQRHGRVFERQFVMASLKDGDHVLMQLTVTGHGWSESTEQCGEYCHMVYRLTINGESIANVTQWRGDCADNPVSDQMGTWTTPRNGWCPGTVEPGLYIDVTHVEWKDLNHLVVDVVVWSHEAQTYTPYTDFAQFFGGNPATLFVGLTLFVYDKSAVNAIEKQPQAYTAAEAALRNGCSYPEALKPPAFVERQDDDSLVQKSNRSVHRLVGAHGAYVGVKLNEKAMLERTSYNARHSRVSRVARHLSSSRYDFESTAPWYLYDKAARPDAGATTRLTIFDNARVQINSRTVVANATKSKLPQEWGQVALRFKVNEPAGDLKIDWWDRVGSIGVLLRENSSYIQLHPKVAPPELRRFAVAWAPGARP